nr:MAG TPA: hypothetical protein [Crassvirales sp.]
METKELKIQAPKGYEIDKENSTFECIRFKPIKKDITYEDMCNVVFAYGTYFTNERGYIYKDITRDGEIVTDKNIASNEKQLRRVLALNQLLNIAEYYNNLHPKQGNYPYCITFEESCGYSKGIYDLNYTLYGLVALFNRAEDAQAVIDNLNFQEILNTIYKN